eukprot:SAG31_NODE_2712_length_5208_cov_1.414563_1_plen_28_part_10
MMALGRRTCRMLDELNFSSIVSKFTQLE